MFSFTLLGTGVNRPTPNRNITSTAVKIGGDTHLIDAPEGVQKQLLEYNVGLKIDSVLLTNQNLENLLGIPGLLTTLGQIAEDNNQPELAHLDIYVPTRGRAEEDTINRVKEFTSLSHSPTNATIHPITYTSECIEGGEYSIHPFRTKQPTNGPSLGYRVREHDRPGEFNRERAEELGVPVGPKFGELHSGESVELEDGRVITPDQVVGETRPGRSLAHTGATEEFDGLGDSIRGVDVLLCDSGITSEDYAENPTDNHMSAYQAGTVAEAANVSVLFPTHIRESYGPNPHVIEPDLRQSFNGEYVLSRDGMAFGILAQDTTGRVSDKSDLLTEIE